MVCSVGVLRRVEYLSRAIEVRISFSSFARMTAFCHSEHKKWRERLDLQYSSDELTPNQLIPSSPDLGGSMPRFRCGVQPGDSQRIGRVSGRTSPPFIAGRQPES